jgi:hypothetical protein
MISATFSKLCQTGFNAIFLATFAKICKICKICKNMYIWGNFLKNQCYDNYCPRKDLVCVKSDKSFGGENILNIVPTYTVSSFHFPQNRTQNHKILYLQPYTFFCIFTATETFTFSCPKQLNSELGTVHKYTFCFRKHSFVHCWLGGLIFQLISQARSQMSIAHNCLLVFYLFISKKWNLRAMVA